MTAGKHIASLKLRVEAKSSKSKSSDFSAITHAVRAVTIALVNNPLKHISIVLPRTEN